MMDKVTNLVLSPIFDIGKTVKEIQSYSGCRLMVRGCEVCENLGGEENPLS